MGLSVEDCYVLPLLNKAYLFIYFLILMAFIKPVLDREHLTFSASFKKIVGHVFFEGIRITAFSNIKQ